ncbi:MAG: cupin domain-containing protein [Candidatus Nitrosopumilus sp. bin_68KS]
MRAENVFILTVPAILSMTSLKKIKINDNLEIDTTGNKIGNICLNRLSKNFFTNEFKSYFIKFEKGSKSKIHLHDSDQIIIGMEGIGQIEILSKIGNQNKFEIKESLELKKDEAVLIPSGIPHWHGATDDHASSQLSFMNNVKTHWF